ncbi:hypothetical protein WH47_01677 [Habropoda laboriosa]|uniref:Uncharacterized protein n=1 Tax=Habropoda laboriosa TaxID=597456 RepID=A0A0L7QZR0_9HYME|nr:hypothetical protein WH47_01677 [Habropoda laboriosa]
MCKDNDQDSLGLRVRWYGRRIAGTMVRPVPGERRKSNRTTKHSASEPISKLLYDRTDFDLALCELVKQTQPWSDIQATYSLPKFTTQQIKLVPTSVPFDRPPGGQGAR